MAPPSDGVEWNDGGIEGTKRFLNKFWDNMTKFSNLENNKTNDEDSLVRSMNQTIFSVTRHLEKFEFNTGVSDLMKANNEISSYLNKNTTVSKETKELVFSSMCNLLYPFSPHISSEIYDLYLNKDISTLDWPTYEESNLTNPTYELVVQINGKKKSLVKVEKNLPDKEVINKIREDEKISNILSDKNLLKHIIVKNRLVNFIVK